MLRIDGRARDILKPAIGDMPVLIQQDQLLVELSRNRTIQSIKAMPDRPATGKLVGTNYGNGLRRAINDARPLEQAAGAPLYLLLDDLVGASLIASRAWSRSRVPGAPQESSEPTRAQATCPTAPGNRRGVHRVQGWF